MFVARRVIGKYEWQRRGDSPAVSKRRDAHLHGSLGAASKPGQARTGSGGYFT